jgi:hypothetical protein
MRFEKKPAKTNCRGCNRNRDIESNSMNELSTRIAKLTPEARKRIEQRLLQTAAERPSVSAIPRRSVLGPTPLSYAQKRMWFLNHLQPDSPLYNLAAAWRLKGFLDLDALQKSLKRKTSLTGTRSVCRRSWQLRPVVLPRRSQLDAL